MRAALLIAMAMLSLGLGGGAGAQPLPSVLDPGVTQVAAGYQHTCALTTTGGVKCWGDNSYGQLGDGSTTNSPTPVDVSGLSSGVVQIAMGVGHTCALTTEGGVKCWGNNSSGQLGDDSITNSSTPVDVSGLSSGVAQIAVGNSHTCALTTAGGVKCWGWNFHGQLGDSSTTNSSTPVDVSGLGSGVAQIATGTQHTCALTTAGGVKCWGFNGNGQLGDGSTTSSPTPVDVSGLGSLGSSVAQIATGDFHTCALTTEGGVKCWGWNSEGQLGDGSNTDRSTPVDVSGLSSGGAQIATGYNHTCALTTDGGVKCWGWNSAGQLGDGSATNSSTPVNVSDLGSSVAQIAAGSEHTCALTSAGGVKCWGNNDRGQLGDGSTTDRWTPVNVSGLSSGVAQIAGEDRHTCALTSAGGIKCWGDNFFGQLGDGSTTSSRTPVDVSGLSSDALQIAAGISHTCALTTTGRVKCWGFNGYGQLGDGSHMTSPTPVDVSGLGSDGAQIATGGYHTCALTNTGGVKCWGWNDSGQLGDDSTTASATPVDVSGLSSGVAQIAAGYLHTCALTTEGGVKCWGYNFNGQLGDGSNTRHLTPVDVIGLGSGVAQIAARSSHTCALTTTGGVKCWGANVSGQLGDGSGAQHLTPVDVIGLGSVVAQIAVGGTHTCALTSVGSVKCWGDNFFGQLGDGSHMTSPTPVDVSGLGSDGAQITAGIQHTCALTSAGGVKCWGYNNHGQLGDGSTTNSSTPVDVRAGQTLAFVPPPSVLVGTPQTLSATASSDLAPIFDTWTPDTCSVTASGTVTPTAMALCGIRISQPGNGNFAPAPQRLVLLPVGASYAITTSANPSSGGTVTCTPNPVDHGEDATCTQTPNAGYTFSNWSGDCSGNSACVLTDVTAAQTVTATYTLDSYAITTSASPTSGGTVTCTPNPVNHGDDVTCTQTPNPGYTFTGWSGDCSGNGSCVLTGVTAEPTVTATYTLDSYAISTSTSPTSGGNVTCSPNPVNHGDDVTCTSTPNAGYTFTGWGGDCSASTGSTCTLSQVAGPLTISASFAMAAVTATQVPALGWPALLFLLAFMLLPAVLFGRGTR